MKKRQLKKLQKKAMFLMIKKGIRTADNYSNEDGEIVAWYQCGGLETEWDCHCAFHDLFILAVNYSMMCWRDGDLQRLERISTRKAFNIVRGLENGYCNGF